MARTSEAIPPGFHTYDPRQWVIRHQRLVSQIFAPSEIEGFSTVTDKSMNSTPIGEAGEIIHCAASQGLTFAVQALLAERRTACDAKDRFGKTPLHWAAGQGHVDTVLALVNAGALVDSRDHFNATPLMLAALGGHEHVVHCLLYAGAGAPNRYNCQGRCHAELRSTALHYAAEGGHVGVIIALLSAGFCNGQPDETGVTAAEISARVGHESSREATRRLLGGDRGGKLVYDYVNMVSQDVATVCGLAQGGAFLDWQDNHRRRSPLHRAVYFGHFQILKILLAAGANPNVADNHAVTPLHMVAVKGCEAEAAELLCAGADTHARTDDSYTPLHLAVVYNRIGVTRLLLDASASSLEVRDSFHGITPLAWASKLSFTTMLRILLSMGADVNSRSPAGLTPLHWACRFNSADIVECLLLAGADPDSLDNEGADAGSVTGLGDPPGHTGPQSPPILPGAANQTGRPKNGALATRIQLALSKARKDRTWRRRGWLVVLARRQAMTMAVVPGTTSRASKTYVRGNQGHPRMTIPRIPVMTGVDGKMVVEDLTGADQKRTRVANETFSADGGGAETCRKENPDLHCKQTSIVRGEGASSFHRFFDGTGTNFTSLLSAPSSAQLGSTGGDITGYVGSGTGWAPERGAIETLLWLAAMEEGVFRNVMRFV
ncbi:unnamed protein product [Ectocarpus sp. CCAP 1310/34]|nr:unnamed protein product [Ectocarpus sp. CCAP 1310/34]